MQKTLNSLLLCLICPLLTFAQGDFSQFRIKTVVIDAGHGGKDPGAVGHKGLQEKDVALAIALKTGNYIKEFVPGVEVIYTRSTDKFVELYQRAKIANKANADLFISIHANAVKNKSHVHGTETFVLGTHRNASNLAVAKRENASILLEKDYLVSYDGFDPNQPNKPETHIIQSLMQSAYNQESLDFAAMVEDQFVTRAKRHSRGVKQAGFMVLYKTTMPSVLVEAGFVTNKDEAKYLASEQGQNEIASAIYRAFKSYKAEMEGTSDEPPVSNARSTPEAVKPAAKTIKEAVVSSEAQVKIPQTADNITKPNPAKTPNRTSETKSSRYSTSSAGISDASGIYRIELYCSEKTFSGKPKKLNEVGEIVVEYNSSKGIRKFMLAESYEAETVAKAKLNELVTMGFKNAKLILYQNGRRIVQ